VAADARADLAGLQIQNAKIASEAAATVDEVTVEMARVGKTSLFLTYRNMSGIINDGIFRDGDWS
jgi:hypothetical protein